VSYLLHEYDVGRDPLTIMNVLKALRWGIRAWEDDIKTLTIENCFKKVLEASFIKAELTDPKLILDVSVKLAQVQLANSSIYNLMDINQFLNPSDKKVKNDNFEALDERVLA
jgi:hypothetical protein